MASSDHQATSDVETLETRLAARIGRFTIPKNVEYGR